MKQPEGFVEPGCEEYVCKLVHTIYGTMQGGHNWYETLGTTFKNLGYSTSHADPCVHIKRENRSYTITDTYIDDIFGASNDNDEIKQETGDWEGMRDKRHGGDRVFSGDASPTGS